MSKAPRRPHSGPPSGAKTERFIASPAHSAALPTPADLAAYVREQGQTDLAELARHFAVKGADRRALREMLRALQGEGGELAKRGRKGVAVRGALPPVGVVNVVDRDVDGELWVRLAKDDDDVLPVRLAPDRDAESRAGAPGLGDKLLVRFLTTEAGEPEARLIRRLGQGGQRLLGVVRKMAGPRGRREVRLEPVDRRGKDGLILSGPDADTLRDGDLVMAQALGGEERRAYGPKHGKVIEVVGREDDPRAFSLLAIAAHDIPTGFPPAAEAEAEAAQAPTLKGRTDLRDLPLITIDPADARDHDDAVFAEADDDPKNKGGWIVWVAIADVAAYVRPGSALDRTAWEKGNSVYFPDRVEPMLPERLSGGLCSLIEGEDRACMAVRMVFDREGRKTGHRFVRGLMRSAAGIAYEQAQDAVEGRPDDATGPILETVLQPLWAAYATLKKGRDARSPLAIESTERRIRLTGGEISSIEKRTSLEAHRLIEEMMIQANVCAAETLEQKKSPLLYRVHDAPSQEKLFALSDFLHTIAMPWTKGEPATTARFNQLLDQTREGPHADIVNEVVLRTQMQAIYNPDNVGHFGLNLARYAHFTSPIRRYADLVVHRALIAAQKLGDDGLTDREITRLEETAHHITATERAAMAAEREATDRYVAAFLSERHGADFDARITGVTRFGLFVRLEESGADGLVPVSTLGGDFWVHDERTHALVAERSGLRFRLGARVSVRLREATPLTGGLVFQMLSDPDPRDPNAPAPRLGVRRRAASDARSRKTGLPKGVKPGKRR
jgi:ribonuclease R